MSLLVTPEQLAERRGDVAGPLAPLADSLAADLAPLFARDFDVPALKALLSREGGRCARDGSLLDFDPWSPHEHRCPTCGATYRGEAHDRFWLYWYHLWLAERSVHAAALHALGGGERYARLAADILTRYADAYLRVPNVDNVLGPTRLFFSTYIESIWLLQMCVALDLLESAGTDGALGALVRDRIVEPSSALIEAYDEGGSNRQVWNAAALLAAARLVRRADDSAKAADGVVRQLETGLLADGTWYEGENYHLFAHRGLWYGVQMAEQAGFELPRHLVARFDEGFATPFITALPDFTFPSRRDSQYAVSLRQWRFAELCELGLARRDDPRLVGALARLYASDAEPRDTGRARSTAEAERNVPASRLTRADLGWRSLLLARPELPELRPLAPTSALLAAQGIAVLRREQGRVYAALDYGTSGGGHGHPDRLDLILCDGDVRWLDDVGTGSYVERTLHWYRSTLAHNAPLVGGRSQRRVDGELLAWEERGAAGWVSAKATIADGALVQRTLVAMPDYLLDVVTWELDSPGESVDLPIHVDGAADALGPLATAVLGGANGLEDGFDFVHDAACATAEQGSVVALCGEARGRTLAAWCASAQRTEWWRAIGPGAPGRPERAFWLLRAREPRGAHRIVWDWSGDVAGVAVEGESVHVTLDDGSRHTHAPTSDGWHVDLHASGARSSIDLGGRVAGGGALAAALETREAGPTWEIRRGSRTILWLGEDDYRRSEQSWDEAGRPGARVTFRAESNTLVIDLAVAPSELTFAPADAVNPGDNEHPDVNGDGVQLHVETAAGDGAWMLVPEVGDGWPVRVRAIAGSGAATPPTATWRLADRGYAMTVRLPIPADAVGVCALRLGLAINEMPRGRARRRGQLVLGGAAREFVYLRGDRLERSKLLPFVLID